MTGIVRTKVLSFKSSDLFHMKYGFPIVCQSLASGDVLLLGGGCWALRLAEEGLYVWVFEVSFCGVGFYFLPGLDG
jgi:hypothetical protein